MSYCYGHEVSKKALYVSQNEGNGMVYWATSKCPYYNQSTETQINFLVCIYGGFGDFILVRPFRNMLFHISIYSI